MSELQQLERDLAYSTARSDIECNCTPVGRAGDLQWDVSMVRDNVWMHEVEKAIRYLELRGLLERDADMPNLVRVLEDG